jgi:ribosomal protein S3
MLKKFLYKIMAWTKTKGIKFEVSGKISVTGNSKKRRRIVKLGCYSLTHKKLKIDYLLDTIRTSTGVLGFRTFITY